MLQNDASNDDGQVLTVPETVEYGGIRCRVVECGLRRWHTITIQFPDSPPKRFRIIYPFGSPGGTLFVDGLEYRVRQISYPAQYYKLFADPNPVAFGQLIPPISEVDLLKPSPAQPNAVPLDGYVEMLVQRRDDVFLRYCVYTFEMSNEAPIAIATSNGNISVLSPEDCRELHNEILLESDIYCNAEVLLAGRTQVIPCFVVAENVICIPDSLAVQREANQAERQYGSLVVIGDFEKVKYNKVTYNLSTAHQARLMIRYMCERGATSPEKSVHRDDIKAYLTKRGAIQKSRSAWRPSQVFGKKRALSEAVHCCDRCAGLYYLK